MPEYVDYRTYAFSVPTDSFVKLVIKEEQEVHISGWPSGTGNGSLPDALVRHINGKIKNEDMKVRLFRLLIAIEETIKYDRTVSRSQGTTDDFRTLRVFVAPEFYFRPDMLSKERGGSYKKAEVEALKGVLKEYFSSYEKWGPGREPLRNWMFVCGTCVFEEKPSISRRWRGDKNTLLAFTIDDKKNTKTHQVLKLAVANGDLVDPRYNLLTNKIEKSPGFVKEGLKDREKHYFREFGVFVEICLEHGLGLLMSMREKVNVGLHIVSAAGMYLQSDNIKDGSRAILCDGLRCREHNLMVYGAYKSELGAYKEYRAENTMVCAITTPWADLDTGRNYILKYYPGTDPKVMNVSRTAPNVYDLEPVTAYLQPTVFRLKNYE